MSTKVKSKFRTDWQVEREWLMPVKTDCLRAQCILCEKSFSVASSGLFQVRQHEATEKHKQIAATRSGTTSQTVLVRRSCNDSSLSLSKKPPFSFTPEDLTLRAEIIWALKCAKSNISFSCNEDIGDILRAMCPDSNVLKNYAMSATKVRYVIEFGLAQYIRECLIEDLKSNPFTFLFDETTTSQVKKQYDGYVQYESKRYKKIVSHYAGSLFVGHCRAEDLKDHIMKFGENLKWDFKHLINVGMDGPNVNKCFHRLLEKELSNVHGKKILNIGTCNLHPVHTAFSKGLAKIPFDFDKLAVNLHFFFKHSSARRKDFELCELETDLETQVMLRHVSSRWLSLRKTLIRIVEQWKNLKEYFLVFLPKEKNFEKEIASSDRYIEIRRALKSDESTVYMEFAIFLAGIMESFLIPFQSTAPMVHLMYDSFGRLFYDIMATFMKTKSIMDGDKRKEANSLGILNMQDTSLQKSAHDVNIGTAARHIIAKLESENKKMDSVKQHIKICLITVTSYLQSHLPFDSNFLRDARSLHPSFKNNVSAQAAFGRLAYMMSIVLNNTGIYIKPAANFSDDMKIQFSLYQTMNFDYNKELSLDQFWTNVGEYVDTDGKNIFREIAILSKNCLCTSHGNAVPERGFSINKRILQDRTSLNENTIIAIRLVKQSIELNDGNVSISFIRIYCVFNFF